MEKNIEDYPSIVTLKKTKIIIDQIENCICKICSNGKFGTGFFCYILNKNNKKIPVFITNYHIIGENDLNNKKSIKISFNNEKKYMDLKIDSKRRIYSNSNYDITIIEIRKDIDNINSFLEIDEKIYENNSNKIFIKSSSYIIQYPNEKGASVSYGLINTINEDCKVLNHYCITQEGSSGSPIINLDSNKVVAVHTGSPKNFKFNKGIFLKYPINEFLNIYNGNNIIEYKDNEDDYKINKNEIKITLKIEESDIDKDIYFLDNTNKYLEKNDEKNPHCHLSELNINNTELYIDEIKYNYQKYFIPPKEGIYEIKLKFNNYIKDCSYMFYYCKNIIDIDFSFFKTQNVINMSNMFCYCMNLKYLDLSSFNTEKVTNMSNMFSYCGNLTKIVLSSFNTQNVIDMRNMFLLCNKLNNIDISSFVASPILNNSLMFDRCRNIKHLKLNKKYGNKFIEDMDVEYIETEFV